PRGDASQEGAPRVSDVRVAAYSVSVRRTEIAEGDTASGRSDAQAALGSARVGPAAEGGEEQRYLPPRDRCHRRVPREKRRWHSDAERLHRGAACGAHARRRQAVEEGGGGPGRAGTG